MTKNRPKCGPYNIQRAYYVVDPITNCWNWVGGKDDEGYGIHHPYGRGNLRAHRYYYEQEYGPIPFGLIVDHTCRNKSCVNPSHLEAITHTDNLRRGNSTKLTVDLVLEIRELHAKGIMKQKDIAAMYGITQPHVSRLVRGLRYVIE